MSVPPKDKLLNWLRDKHTLTYFAGVSVKKKMRLTPAVLLDADNVSGRVVGNGEPWEGQEPGKQSPVKMTLGAG